MRTQDYADLIVNPAGGILTAYYQATGNRIGATCLQIICIGCQLCKHSLVDRRVEPAEVSEHAVACTYVLLGMSF